MVTKVRNVIACLDIVDVTGKDAIDARAGSGRPNRRIVVDVQIEVALHELGDVVTILVSSSKRCVEVAAKNDGYLVQFLLVIMFEETLQLVAVRHKVKGQELVYLIRTSIWRDVDGNQQFQSLFLDMTSERHTFSLHFCVTRSRPKPV
jgi:hypothetical protein